MRQIWREDKLSQSIHETYPTSSSTSSYTQVNDMYLLTRSNTLGDARAVRYLGISNFPVIHLLSFGADILDEGGSPDPLDSLAYGTIC